MRGKTLKASHEGLRPQARVGAQPPKAALSAETEGGPAGPDEGRAYGGCPSVGGTAGADSLSARGDLPV